MSLNMIEIESLDMDGRGVGHLQNEDGSAGKVVFVEGALPGEHVSYQTYRKKAHWEAATLIAVHRESALRVKPKCDYSTCAAVAQCSIWSLRRRWPPSSACWKIICGISDGFGQKPCLRPIYGPTWGYRYRARLSVNHVPKKGGVLVGFHEKKSRYITDMKTCEILPPHVSAMLVPLRHLIESLTIVRQVPQIELASDREMSPRWCCASWRR